MRIDARAMLGQFRLMEWHEFKNWLVEVTMLDRDALHIYFAVLIQLLAAWVLRRSIGSIWPWLVVFFIALINEYFDYDFVRQDPKNRDIFMMGAYHDMWNTMLLPTILMVISRFWPKRLVKAQEVLDEDGPETD